VGVRGLGEDDWAGEFFHFAGGFPKFALIGDGIFRAANCGWLSATATVLPGTFRVHCQPPRPEAVTDLWSTESVLMWPVCAKLWRNWSYFSFNTATGAGFFCLPAF